MTQYIHNIILESIDRIRLKELLSSCSWHDIDFLEGDVEEDNCERLIVTVRGIEVPIDVINLKCQLTTSGRVQLHIFIDDSFQGCGIGTKVYMSYIHQFGELYSGLGRVMNMDAILKIYEKRSHEPDIDVNYLVDANKKPIAIEAKLKQ